MGNHSVEDQTMDEAALWRFFQSLDRAAFMDPSTRAFASIDAAFPIGFGQTISQPSLVFEMTRLLNPAPESRVLEIGTGTGYQTALLARFSASVHTVERIPGLAESARARLERMGYANIEYRIGDGSDGWPEAAPFDRIMVTAAAARFPEDLAAQLAPLGRMIVPVGAPGMQRLFRVEREADGKLSVRALEAVAFVELVGRYGWHA